jgi:hypothetical protein
MPGREPGHGGDLHWTSASNSLGVNLTVAQVAWKIEVVVATLEMLSGGPKKEYAKEAQAVADAPDDAPAANGAAAESDLEALVAM